MPEHHLFPHTPFGNHTVISWRLCPDHPFTERRENLHHYHLGVSEALMGRLMRFLRVNALYVVSSFSPIANHLRLVRAPGFRYF